MEIIELLLIIVGCLALVVAIATAIIKVSSFYRTQFGFSVWSGVLLLFLAFVLMLIYYGGEKPQSILSAKKSHKSAIFFFKGFFCS